GAAGDLFGRQAYVTIGGAWGTFGAGMQMDPGLIASASTEPRGLPNSFSMLSQWVVATVFNGAGAGASGSLQGGVFDQNALSYTYARNGFYLGLEHALGGVSGSALANTTSSLGLSYTASGFTGSFSFVRANSKTPGAGKQSEIAVIGGAYTLEPYALRAQLGDFRSAYVSGIAGHDVRAWGIGLDAKMFPKQVWNISYYGAKDSGASFGGKATELALMDSYELLKDMQMYGQIAAVRADANAGYAAAFGGIYTAENGLTSAAGETTTFVGVGMRYVF
ncbi:MAG: porin, partial [Betaproteobacteria bacterium]|nr:porin [Betaproteobacteria bacterium]